MARNRFNSGTATQEELNKVKINKQSLKTLSYLLTYLKPYKWKLIIGLICLFISSFTFLTIPALLGSIIDAAKGEDTQWFLPNDINQIGFIAFIILFIQAVVSFFRVHIFVGVAEMSIADLRKDTYFKLITLPMDFFSNHRVGELNSRLSADLSQIQDTLTSTLAEVIRQLVFLAGGISLLIFVSPHLTLFNIIILPLLIVCAVFFGKAIRKISRRAQDQLAESNTIVEETLQGIANVKSFANEAYEAGRYDNSLRKVVTIALRSASLRASFSAFIIFCLFGAVVGVVWYGSVLVQTGQLSIGDLSTYIIYSMFVGSAMGTFPDLYANIQKALGSTERVIEILHEKGEPVSIIAAENATKHKLSGSLEFDDVRFFYPSRKEVMVLKGLSFSARAGQKIAIVGPSGAGKSTIASLILRFYAPQHGFIRFDGKASEEYPLTDIRNQVAIVPQDVLLFGGSIRENIAYGRLEASDEEVYDAAKKANAHSFIMQMPEGYDTIVGERGVKLSGGQRQRIAIARALLKDPAILILDEATSSLDSESERLVQEALEVLMKGRTSIIIAHRLSTIREADKILVVDEGRVAESGTHAELLQRKGGLYQYLSQLQFDEKA